MIQILNGVCITKAVNEINEITAYPNVNQFAILKTAAGNNYFRTGEFNIRNLFHNSLQRNFS
jgi:hypothetical protein